MRHHLTGSIWHTLTRRRKSQSVKKNHRATELNRWFDVLEDRSTPSTFTVTILGDTPVAGQTTLRQAVESANSSAGADTITFKATLAGTITLGGTQLELSDTSGATTISGPGADILAVSGGNLSRVFKIDGGVTATLMGLTIRNGSAGVSALGSGIENSGNLTVAYCTVTNNSSVQGAGGIMNWDQGTLTVSNSTVSNNTAGPYGAGGILHQGVQMTISNCTFSGNSSATVAGGINCLGPATIVNSTIVGNTANSVGGGIRTDDVVTFTNCTIAGNRGDADGNDPGPRGGGIITYGPGPVTLRNTIVAGNLRGTGTIADDLWANNIEINGVNNLVGDAGSAGGLVNGTNGNIVGVAGVGVRPINTILSMVLNNNGGPTRTLALVAGSVAIGAGSSTIGGLPATDQRGGGFKRTELGTPDIGAYELRPALGSEIAGRNPTTGAWQIAVPGSGGSVSNLAGPTWAGNVNWLNTAAVDLNGDGWTDFVGRNPTTGVWQASIANGTGGFSNSSFGVWSVINWDDVHFGDFNADGKIDVVGRWRETGQWWTGLSNGTSFKNTYWGQWSVGAGVTWVDVNVGDLDGDGDTDFLGRWAETGNWYAGISGNNAMTNTYWGQWSAGAGVTWVDIRMGDLDGDGKADILGRWKESGQMWAGISIGYANSNVYWGSLTTGVTWTDVRMADFDNDGRSDLMCRYKEAGQWYGVITDSSPYRSHNALLGAWSASVNWVDVLAIDVDQDGKADLVGRDSATGQWTLAKSNGTTFATSIYTIWSNAIAWADARTTRTR